MWNHVSGKCIFVISLLISPILCLNWQSDLVDKDRQQQAYYCEQDYVTQAAALSAPCGPVGSNRDTGRTLAKKGTKATVTHDRPSIGEPPEAPSGSDGSTGPSI